MKLSYQSRPQQHERRALARLSRSPRFILMESDFAADQSVCRRCPPNFALVTRNGRFVFLIRFLLYGT